MIFMHGAPGSRLSHAYSGALARDLGFRVIAPDRPGFGQSDFDRKRTLISWADDVAVLADHLGFERFIVAGKSAGAPHAAACGWRQYRQSHW